MHRHPWHPPLSHSPPSPPAEVNGWGKFVAATLADHGVWLQVIRSRQEEHDDRLTLLERQQSVPASPSKSDRAELLREINSGLRTLAAIALVVAVLAGWVDPATIDALKKAASIAP